jgi:hypothetical protein
MKLFLRTGGGLANLRLAGEVDTRDLPEELALEVRERLDPAALRRYAQRPPGPGADGQEVQLTITRDQTTHELQLDESNLPDEVLETLDTLRHEITRRLMRARGRESNE